MTACYIMAGSGGTATGAWAGWEKRVARVALLFAWCRFRRRLARLVHRRSRALFLQRHQLGPQLGQYIDLAEISPPSSPGTDVGRLYAKDVAGVTKLAFRDHAGTETVLGSGSGGSSAGHSLLHNPDFRIATRGTSFTSAGNFPNNDEAYLLDGAVLLSDGNNV
ncbi:MAG TPA: hypothetical protein VFI48_06865, partial [Hyphomicrobiaceae bacterium]|nr:hypothetical protein [Hyphomicrobiaceae bacterium]